MTEQEHAPVEQTSALSVVLDRGREQFALALQGGPVSLGDFEVGLRAAAMAVPDLLRCMQEYPASVMQCLVECAQLQLSPAPAKAHFHLIPRKMKQKDGSFRLTCTRIIGKRGLVHLADRSGRLEEIDSMVLYRSDIDKLAETGTPVIDPRTGELNVARDPFLRGETEETDKDIVGAVAWARIQGRPRPVSRILTRQQIEKRRDVSGFVSPAWRDWYAEMCEKTILRALLMSGLVPLGEDAERVQRALSDAVVPEEHAQVVILDDPPDDPNEKLMARLDARKEREATEPATVEEQMRAQHLANGGEETSGARLHRLMDEMGAPKQKVRRLSAMNELAMDVLGRMPTDDDPLTDEDLARIADELELRAGG